MSHISQNIELVDIPDYVKSWAAANIPDFVSTVLSRWEREYGVLPNTFYVLMCPQVEINARGGLPKEVYEFIDPKLSCRHFTGCHKPYFFAIFVGDQAEEHCIKVQQMLAWSEAYKVEIEQEKLVLWFLGCQEVIDNSDMEQDEKLSRFKDLVATGQIIRILE